MRQLLLGPRQAQSAEPKGTAGLGSKAPSEAAGAYSWERTGRADSPRTPVATMTAWFAVIVGIPLAATDCQLAFA